MPASPTPAGPAPDTLPPWAATSGWFFVKNSISNPLIDALERAQ